jgi:hypothetical protein
MLNLKFERKKPKMDVVDSSIRVFQTVFPSVMQHLGRAKDREVEAAREEEKKEIAQTKAQLEVLVMKNQELIQANQDLEAFKNVVLVLLFVAALVFLGMALGSESA